MKTRSPRLLRAVGLAAGCIGLAVTATIVAPAFGTPASVHVMHGSVHVTHVNAVKHPVEPPVVAGSRYLALGDSVPFGYREGNSIPAPNFNKAINFTGYPEDVAANLRLRVTNLACPGETTASMINFKAQSNGCENHFVKGGPNPAAGGYRSLFPLHTKYAGSQLTFAEAYLKKFPNTRLVTLMIGANDAFICQTKFSDGCLGEFPALLASLGKNVTTILKGLRDTAHYTGQLVLVSYYSLDYSNSKAGQLQKSEVQALNGALENAAKPFYVRIASGYGQFKKASAQGRGIPCTAQLLTALSGADKGTCGVHPSLSGAALLAQAVERAIKT